MEILYLFPMQGIGMEIVAIIEIIMRAYGQVRWGKLFTRTVIKTWISTMMGISTQMEDLVTLANLFAQSAINENIFIEEFNTK